MAAGGLLGGCRDPLGAPIDLYHNLEGGEIAAQRPPPPGAGQPYPHLGTTPEKPKLPDPAFRNGLQAQLLAERDRTERVAADTPVMPLVPPPPPALPPPTPAAAPAVPGQAAGQDANQGQPGAAAATLDTADAPPPKPAPAPKTGSGSTPPVVVTTQDEAMGPPPGAPLTILGAPTDFSGAPDLPAAPPPPATFEGVAAEPMPTPRVLPAGLAGAPAGTQVYFPEGSYALPPNQTQALKDFLSLRKKQSIVVIGLGGAASDSPDNQAAAIALGLQRAASVATALAGLHVPQSAIRLQAQAFGSGAVLQLSF